MNRIKINIGTYTLQAFALAWAILAVGCQRFETSHEPFAPIATNSNNALQKQLDFLTERINDNSLNPEFYYQRAQLNYNLDKLRTALRDIEACIKLDGEKGAYLYWKANILAGLKDHGQALEIAGKAVAMGVNHADMDILLGKLYYLNGNSADALQYLQRAYLLFPNNAEAAFYIGAIFDDRQDTTTALREMRHAITVKPNMTEAYLRIMQLYERYELHEQARPYAAQALENCSSDAGIFLELGDLLRNTQAPDSAAYWYRRTLQLKPAAWQAHYWLGQYHLDLNNYLLAESYLKEALAYNPNIEGGYFQIGYVYEYYLSDFEAAKTAYQKGLRIDTANTEELEKSLKRIDRKIAYKAMPSQGLPIPRNPADSTRQGEQ